MMPADDEAAIAFLLEEGERLREEVASAKKETLLWVRNQDKKVRRDDGHDGISSVKRGSKAKQRLVWCGAR
jgi:hypothetical protein